MIECMCKVMFEQIKTYSVIGDLQGHDNWIRSSALNIRNIPVWTPYDLLPPHRSLALRPSVADLVHPVMLDLVSRFS